MERALKPGERRDRAVDQARARETRRLLERYHRLGDRGARDALIERFLPLARQLARRYAGAGENLEDLIQVASIGLVKAVDRFDASRGVAFSSYAVPTMLGEIKRYFRDSGWAVHVPRGVQERVMKVDRASKALGSKLGRPPSVAEIATAIEASQEEVLEAMEASQAYDAVSLDAPRAAGDNEADPFGESLGADDERFDLVEHGAAIAGPLSRLPPRDRIVLHLRFSEDMTQSEIAERIGVSQMQVSRLIRRALARLREDVGEPAEE
jgi:RNA polymerase sigma-B factor